MLLYGIDLLNLLNARRAVISLAQALFFGTLARSLLDPHPMRTLFSSAVFAACLTLGGIGYAQEQGQTPPPSQQRQSDASKVSVTGCLAKGNVANAYTITDQKSGQVVPFNGPEKLDQYVNQTVTLTGTMGSDKTFKPETIKQVATTCEKGQ